MKIMTFVVPCYNSAAYMRKCIDSLLVAGNDIQIILINDGSTKDNTAEICDQYASNYPHIVKTIHQENGGHGEGVNQGLQHADGLFFKVVDSDDWLDSDALQKVMTQLRNLMDHPVDVLLTNYVYEKVHINKKKVMKYTNVFPTNTTFTWHDIGLFRPSQYLLMHTVIYRTQILKMSGIHLPKHTFYVDNLFVYQPLPYVKTMYYLNVDLYRYFIGREGQSINEQIMIRRVDQQLSVTRKMMTIHHLQKIIDKNPKLGHYMTNYLSMMMTISTILLLKSNTEEAFEKKEALWQDLKNYDKNLYRRMKYTKISSFTMLPSNLGRKTSLFFYNLARRLYRFN